MRSSHSVEAATTMVTNLSARSCVERPESVTELIALALARRGKMNAVVSIEIEEWRSDELRDYIEARNAEDGDWLFDSA